MSLVMTPVLADDLDDSITTHKPTKHTVRTVIFRYGSTEYEIDLNDKHESELRAILDHYIPHARPAGNTLNGGRSGRVRTRTTSTLNGSTPNGSSSDGDLDNDDVRAWAKANGIHVKGKGRISMSVKAAYRAARDAGKVTSAARNGRQGKSNGITVSPS